MCAHSVSDMIPDTSGEQVRYGLSLVSCHLQSGGSMARKPRKIYRMTIGQGGMVSSFVNYMTLRIYL